MAAWFFCTLCALLASSTAKIVPADPDNDISWPYQVFETVDFTPPYVNFTHHTAPSEGYLFFAPDGATPVQMAPVVMDMYGELIWNGPEQHAFNFGVYEYQGEQVLAWWNGSIFPEPVGRGNGVIHIYNNKYQQTHKVTLPGNFLELEPGVTFPSNIDLHEVLFTPKGSMVVTANNVTQADLTSVGGPTNGWVVASMMYEIDIESNEVLFEWNSLDHLDELPFTASLYTIGAEGYTGANQSLAWGYFHINAAEPYEGGYILSSRYFCSAIAIDASGDVKWRLSGREGGDFKLVGDKEKTGFCFQHDIRVVDQSASGVTLRMHDNHNSPIENNTVPSTGKIVHANFETKEATLVQRLLNASGPIFSTAQGNYQPLANGNEFIGHGWIPVMEEYSPGGEILTTIQFGEAEARPGGGYVSLIAPTLSYRDYKHHWVGCPVTKPDVVAKSAAGGVDVFVSWNGATEVKAWEISSGSSEGDLASVATVKKNGFETKVHIGAAQYVQVRPVMKDVCKCSATPASAVVKVS